MDRLRLQRAAALSVQNNGFHHHHHPPEKDAVLMKNQLLDLERHLFDDDDDDDQQNLSISGLTSNEWREEGLITPSPPSSASSSTQTSLETTKQLLLDSASAIEEGDVEAASSILTNLSIRLRETQERFHGYILRALLARINPPTSEERSSPSPSPPQSPSQVLMKDLSDVDHMEATRLLYTTSPCYRVAILAADLAIADALRGHSDVHILDFDFNDGTQYLPLLSEHRDVKITAVVDADNPYGMNSIDATRLGGRFLAQRNASFRVAIVRGSELTRRAVSCGPEEVLAVRLPFVLSRVADESVTTANPRDVLLRAVRRMRPRVVAVAEEEMNCNTARLAVRVAEAWEHYGAVLESVEAEGSAKGIVEDCVGRIAANVAGEDGSRRVERFELYGKWRARITMAGYLPVGIGDGVAESASRRGIASASERSADLKAEDDGGAIKISWKGKVLVVVSLWR